MFLTSSIPNIAGQDTLLFPASEGLTERQLLERIRRAFPDLAIVNTRIENSGGDHVLLIADEQYAFRFPRPGQHTLTNEIAVLHLLRQRVQVTVPAYEFVDPAGTFAGYQLIPGAQLSPALFATRSDSDRDIILRGVAQLLDTLHAIDPAAVMDPAAWPSIWTAAEFADRALRQRLARVAPALPTLTDAMVQFFEMHRQDRPEQYRVIHGDLVSEHILVDESSSALAGIIDFGDVALGDPAQDFAGLWAYGQDAAIRACELYAQGKPDPGLIGRSRNHFIRYRIDRFYEQLTDGVDRCAMEPEAAEIGALLSRPFPQC